MLVYRDTVDFLTLILYTYILIWPFVPFFKLGTHCAITLLWTAYLSHAWKLVSLLFQIPCFYLFISITVNLFSLCGNIISSVTKYLLSECSVMTDHFVIPWADCSLPAYFVHEIFPGRIVEWVAISSSRVSSRPTQGSNLCLLHWQAASLQLSHLGSPPSVYLHLILKL